jgi:hypothetical protein
MCDSVSPDVTECCFVMILINAASNATYLLIAAVFFSVEEAFKGLKALLHETSVYVIFFVQAKWESFPQLGTLRSELN